ncbi:MAG: T9SS type A sorting domain-containing protein [Dysgonamonadaceae bacterium]|nr:T9SS type A sorting domain-containing protein [Dysgonamonadaceae bacterium]
MNTDNNFSVFAQNNSQGALLVTENIALVAGNNMKTLNVNLIQGIYIVKIVYKNTVTTLKVVK